jgi:hypothetical protein
MTADCLTKRERAWKWLNRRSAWAAALFALAFMGCTNPFNGLAGEPCMGSPNPRPVDAIHDDEHAARLAGVGEHTMNATAGHAEAAVRHEAATGH